MTCSTHLEWTMAPGVFWPFPCFFGFWIGIGGMRGSKLEQWWAIQTSNEANKSCNQKSCSCASLRNAKTHTDINTDPTCPKFKGSGTAQAVPKFYPWSAQTHGLPAASFRYRGESPYENTPFLWVKSRPWRSMPGATGNAGGHGLVPPGIHMFLTCFACWGLDDLDVFIMYLSYHINLY